MVCDVLCHNSQDRNGQELYTLDEVSYEVGYMFYYSEIFFSLNDLFIKMFLKR